MKLPFTTEQFFNVFENYNTNIFPVQIVILLAGLIVLLMAHRDKQLGKSAGIFLGLLWMWIGAVYHLAFFSSINKPAIVFGVLFILQGILFFLNAFSKSAIQIKAEKNVRSGAGEFLVIFGLIIYPVIGYLVEGSVTRIISLGLPCPSTILTFGFLMMATNRVPKYLLIIPFIWSLVGLSAALNFGVYQDYMLIVSAVLATIVLFRKK